MELKLTNDTEIIKLFLNDLEAEYKNDKYIKYDNERLKREYESLINGETRLYVLLKNSIIIAYLSLRNENNGIVCFHNVFVKKNYRKMGYGKMLLERGFGLAKSFGCSKVVLASRRGKEGFYFKCGLRGEGLLQADIDKYKKNDIEKILIQNNVKEYKYKLWNDSVHQFFVNLNDIIYLDEFLRGLENKGYSFNILFSKTIE